MKVAMKVPARLGKDVRILERHGAKRQGVIISSDGKNLWSVKFDNEDQTVPKMSRHLKIFFLLLNSERIFST